MDGTFIETRKMNRLKRGRIVRVIHNRADGKYNVASYILQHAPFVKKNPTPRRLTLTDGKFRNVVPNSLKKKFHALNAAIS